MRKFLSVVMLILVVLLVSIPVVFASIALQVDGDYVGKVESINLTGPGSFTRTGNGVTLNVVDQSLIAAGAANGGATSMTTAQLAVPVSYSYVRKALTSNAGYTAGTLANGKKGQLLTIHAVAGSGTFVITPTTKTGIATVSLDTVGDIIQLLYVDDTVGWILAANSGATVVVP